MKCPDCLSEGTLRPREQSGQTDDGEPWIHEYFECTACGANYTETELLYIEQYGNVTD